MRSNDAELDAFRLKERSIVPVIVAVIERLAMRCIRCDGMLKSHSSLEAALTVHVSISLLPLCADLELGTILSAILTV